MEDGKDCREKGETSGKKKEENDEQVKEEEKEKGPKRTSTSST
jgi:hypothetical protein